VKPYSNFVLLFSLLLGLVFSSILGWSFYDLETRTIASRFAQDVDEQASSIEREIALNFEAVYALKGLYDSSENVTAEEFKQFSSQLLARHSNIQALEWSPKIKHRVRIDYELNRQQDYPEFIIIERNQQGNMITAAMRDEYFPVSFLEPYIGNEAALGFDLTSNVKRHKALNSATQSGNLVITPNITLVQNQKGFLAFLPIYQGRPITKDERAAKLLGFVIAVFRINDLIEKAITRSSQQKINFNLVDVTLSPPEKLFQYDVPLSDAKNKSAFLYQKSLMPLGGRQWNILATPTNKYFSEHRSSTPFVIALLVAIFIIFGIVYIFLLARHSSVIEQTVVEKTAELNETKTELARITLNDNLTGLANRRRFDAYLKQEWARAMREKQPLSLIMIEIDYFKQFIDHYGYQSGDSCLKLVASTVESTAKRATDLVARYDDEVFIIILANVEATEASTLAELCRESIEKTEISHISSNVSEHITISVGCSTLVPEANSKPFSLVNRVDEALYKAKSSGRNQSHTI
jgi:diguanylate cyclase (GGDEF)-like protein